MSRLNSDAFRCSLLPVLAGAMLATVAMLIYGHYRHYKLARIMTDSGDIVQELQDDYANRVWAKKVHLIDDHPDYLRIYQTATNNFEVWINYGGMRKWTNVPSLEEARKAKDDYFTQWARNCAGDMPTGKRIE